MYTSGKINKNNIVSDVILMGFKTVSMIYIPWKYYSSVRPYILKYENILSLREISCQYCPSFFLLQLSVLFPGCFLVKCEQDLIEEEVSDFLLFRVVS